jgi:DNA primase
MLVDTEAVRRRHPLADVVAAYGIELRRCGSALVGRCPFHADRGRPNLTVFSRSGRWVCFRCGEKGDVIGFVQQIEHLDFRMAVTRLDATATEHSRRSPRPSVAPVPPVRAGVWLGPAELEVLAAAVELYANRLLTEERALAYLAGRGFERSLLERYQVGYASGGELVGYLRWRGLPLEPAVRAGVLDRDLREVLRGRVVVSERRRGSPVWLIGRQLDADVFGQPRVPKYLSLPGRKPLLGWEEAVAAETDQVTVVEGPLDWLAVRAWGVPAIALCGNRVRPAALEALHRFERVYLALDADEGGDIGSEVLLAALGDRARRVCLPKGCKDVAELAPRPDGARVFATALQAAEQVQARHC